MNQPFEGLKVLVTSGSTKEAIDPVRYITNHSSGKQGNAIAEAFAQTGASITLITTEDTHEVDKAIRRINCVSADDMLAACLNEIEQGIDVVVAVAAVCDWKPKKLSASKLKKQAGTDVWSLELVKTPDIINRIATSQYRPRLVVGFAAETGNLIEYAKQKRKSKQLDWIVANDIEEMDVFGQDENKVFLITHDTEEEWEVMSKFDIGKKLVKKVKEYFDK